jgi:hypothetical protein
MTPPRLQLSFSFIPLPYALAIVYLQSRFQFSPWHGSYVQNKRHYSPRGVFCSVLFRNWLFNKTPNTNLLSSTEFGIVAFKEAATGGLCVKSCNCLESRMSVSKVIIKKNGRTQRIISSAIVCYLLFFLECFFTLSPKYRKVFPTTAMTSPLSKLSSTVLSGLTDS